MSTLIDNKDLLPAILASAGRYSSDNFAQIREQALKAFAELGLPGRKTEEYRFTPITRAIEKLFAVWPETTAPSSVLADITPYLIESLDASVIVLLNGAYDQKLSMIKDPSLAVSNLKDPSDSISQVLFNQADFAADPFVAWNTAAWSGGVAIEVKNKSRIDRPVLLLNIVDSSLESVVMHSRVLAEVGSESSLTLISRNIVIGDKSSFSTMVEEILVGDNASFEYCRIQDQDKETSFTQTSILQLSNSHVNTFTLTLDGNLVRNNLNIAIDGERTESHFHGLYLIDGDTVADNHTVVDHRKPNSVSNEMYKGVMNGNSKGIFNGKIYVRPHAQKTNAFQSNRNILLSDKATINTKPQLEIWADDVKCSHGCTTGQLDEEAMFYLRSRGIPKDEAQAMLLLAFVAETYSFIANETLRSYITRRVSERLNS